MFQAFRMLFIAALLAFSASAQLTVITVDVKCNSQTQTDDRWELDVTVTDGVTDTTITVSAPKHSDAEMMTAAIAKKLNKKLGMKHGTAPCFVNGETTNESGKVTKRTAEDVTAPTGYTFKSVATRKETSTNTFTSANDHVQVYDGGSKIN